MVRTKWRSSGHRVTSEEERGTLVSRSKLQSCLPSCRSIRWHHGNGLNRTSGGRRRSHPSDVALRDTKWAKPRDGTFIIAKKKLPLVAADASTWSHSATFCCTDEKYAINMTVFYFLFFCGHTNLGRSFRKLMKMSRHNPMKQFSSSTSEC